MDGTSLKIRMLFESEVKHAARSGELDPTFHSLLTDMFGEWSLETTAVEGTNNHLKSIVRTAPFISWQLLSDRLTAAKYVRGMGLDKFDELVSNCEESHHFLQKTLTFEDESRYFAFVDGLPDAAASRPDGGAAHGEPRKKKATPHEVVASCLITKMKNMWAGA